MHITGRRYQNRCGQATAVKVYSNRPQVTLLANGKPVGHQTGDRVFIFENVPLQTQTTLCAIAGECRDEITLHRVSEPEKGYVYQGKGEGQMVSNWFTQQAGGGAPLVDNVYSLKDSIGELLVDPRTSMLLEECLPEIVHDERTKMYGGMSLLRVLDRNASLCSEQVLKELNQKLNQIAKLQ